MVNEVERGVVSVGFEVQADFQRYKSGIYKPALICGYRLNHGMANIGFNTKEGYFIIRNSWGERWGEKGYSKVAIGTGTGTCGLVNRYDVIPVLE